MKIGLVCPYNIERSGGVLEVILALREGLTARGHKVLIITPNPNQRDPDAIPGPGVIYAGTSLDFRTLSFGDTTSQVSSTTDNERIDAMLSAEKFDILHFHEPWIPLLSRQLLQRSNAVNIGTFHSKVPEAIMTRSILKVVYPYLKSVLKYLDVLTAVSPSSASYLLGLTDEPINYVPNGIDLSKYHPAKKKPVRKNKQILYVGVLKDVRALNICFKPMPCLPPSILTLNSL
jgi:phosphatidylinositol alpha-mannosyltransferase